MALIQYLTNVHFEFGAVRLLKHELARLGIRAPLLVTDRGIAQSGILQRVRAHLPSIDADRIFEGTPQNPTEAAAAVAAAQFRARGCDGIVAIGGGSPIDLAKAAALMATHGGSLEDFAAAAGGIDRITREVAPVIAVPTTAGTGTEVGRAAVIVMENGRKMAVVSQYLVPRSAVCDPELTLTLPAGLTAGTGMDAIAHCVETLLSPAENPPADAIALDGLARGAAHIEQACADGGDRGARWEMMMASLEGGLAFQKGLGAVHAMSHPLGALRGVTVHHGTANAILLPAVLRFNAPSAGSKYARMRLSLGLPAGSDVALFFERLAGRIGLPSSLRAIGVAREELPALAEAAAMDFSARTNPRPADADAYLRLYQEAYG
ncbi:MAG TPA: iron-containing alcohol dehydrogenase [Opitutaceae bacterium]|nr:iron-containing alcohol dehydrogenase [Opitutaceae bacterium]